MMIISAIQNYIIIDIISLQKEIFMWLSNSPMLDILINIDQQDNSTPPEGLITLFPFYSHNTSYLGHDHLQ